MIRTDYAAYLKGLKIQREDGSTSYYQCMPGFSIGIGTRLIRELPSKCELIFFDPRSSGDEQWLFVRRAGLKTWVMKVGRGTSEWSLDTVEAVAALLMESPLVKHPSDESDSFCVRVFDESSGAFDRDEETAGCAPWWKFWAKDA